MAVVLALLAAASYGISDFLGGLASRTARAMSVLLVNYPFGALVMAALLPLFPGHVSGSTLLWSLGGGVFGMLGVGLLYSALGRAPMNVVSPVTAVLAAVVPVGAGLLIGERPGAVAWAGVALGLVAVVLVSRSRADGPLSVSSRAVLMSLGAGVGFGLYFVSLARSDADSGLWPVVIARLTSTVLIVPVALRSGAFTLLRGRLLLLALASGALDAAANLAFLEASRHGYLSLSSVITSLYPAGTVLLAAVLLRERTTRLQNVGLAVAALSVVLVAR